MWQFVMNVFITVSALCRKASVLLFPGLVRTDVPLVSMHPGKARLFALSIDNRNLIWSEENAVPDSSGYI